MMLGIVSQDHVGRPAACDDAVRELNFTGTSFRPQLRKGIGARGNFSGKCCCGTSTIVFGNDRVYTAVVRRFLA